MIYTPEEYAKEFTFGGKYLSRKSIIRRCIAKMLPRGHRAYYKSCVWIIEVPDISDNILRNYNLNIKMKELSTCTK